MASFCDSLGNIIMYTNGENVWNKFGRIMKNGSGLYGSYTSTQSAIIVPKPSTKDLFYIFTVDSQAQPKGYGLCYSLVNVRNQNFEGEVIQKNVFLRRPVPEKLTSVRHSNNQDFWVISHEWGTNKFLSYLVTANGVADPIVSSVGLVHAEPGNTLYNINSLGYMKVSPLGDKIAVAQSERALVEVFDFDNSTGIVSNGFTVPTGNWPYGIEFSPNGHFLYVSEEMSIGQLNLWAGTNTQQIKSYQLITESLKNVNHGNNPTIKFEYGALQLASDGRIYVAVHGLPRYQQSKYLSLIQYPNSEGLQCGYKDSAVYLNGRICTLGLPNFMQSYFINPGFRWFGTCYGDTTNFSPDQTLNYEDISWEFGDIGSGLDNTSTKVYPTHVFSKSGSYVVKMKFTYHSNKDSILRRIVIADRTNISLGSDMSKCKNDTIWLKVSSPYSFFKWSDNTKDSTFRVTAGGVYTLLLTNQYGCKSQSKIAVKDIEAPKPNLGADTAVCEGDKVKLSAQLLDCTYSWQDHSTKSFFEADTSGLYFVRATNAFGCSGSDSVNIKFKTTPRFNLGQDTILCPDQRVRLSVPSYPDSHILWNTGNELDHLDVMKSGLYWCTIKSNNGCMFTDTIQFQALSRPVAHLGLDTIVCQKSNLSLGVAEQLRTSYKWSDGSTVNRITVTQPSKVWVEVTNVCGSVSDTINVKFRYCANIKVPNIITPNGDGLNDYLYVTGIEGEIWQIYIYNRWGELVYDSSNYDNQWPSRSISDGVYYYILKNVEHDAESHGYLYVNH